MKNFPSSWNVLRRVFFSGIASCLFVFSPNEILNDQREESSDAAMRPGKKERISRRKRKGEINITAAEPRLALVEVEGTKRNENITNNVKYKNI
jgi:hypothetical protein